MALIEGADAWSADGNEVGVVVVHGFTGSPRSVRPWGEHLADAGYSVEVPRLPGHGTQWQEMNATRWQDWYAEVDRAFTRLQNKCDKVFVCGLSMGGTLSLRLAEEKGDALAGLVIVNPSVHTERLDRFLLPILHRLVPGWPGISNDIKKEDVDEGAYDKIPLKAMSSLSELWRLVKKDIELVHQPLTIYRSVEDHVVEPSNSEWILQNVRSPMRTEVLLEHSYHVATLDHDAPIIFNGTVDFIKAN